MASLLDTIKQNSQNLLAQNKMGVTDQSAKLASALRARQGKVGTDPEIARSNIAEKAAVQQANTQLRNEVVPQAQLQEQQINQAVRAEEQDLGIRKADIAQTRRANEVENQIRTNELLQSAEQSRGKLDLEKDNATAEQIAHNLRLQNKSYIDNLQREGNRARLNNDAAFREEYAQAAFRDSIDLAKNRNMLEAVLNEDEREFNKQLANMSIEDAWSAFRQDMRDAKSQQTWEAIGGVVSTGIQAGGAYSDAKNKKAYQEYVKSNQGKPTDDYATWDAKRDQ